MCKMEDFKKQYKLKIGDEFDCIDSTFTWYVCTILDRIET